jgi:nicotinamidase-related amidase
MTEKNSETAITIDPAKTALLLIHWQNDIAAPGGKIAGNIPERLAVAHTIEHTQAVLKASREKGMLIVFINGSHRPGYPEAPARPSPLMTHLIEAGSVVRGTWGAAVIDQLKPLADEIFIDNSSASGFYSTELDVILRGKGITNIVLSGFATNWAVESTARDGANRGYFIYTLEDCCNSLSDEMHKWTLTNIFPVLGIVLDSKAYVAAL